MSKKLSQILEDCRVMVQNAANDEQIKTALSVYGYTDEELNTGITLYEDVLNLFGVQKKERIDLAEVSDQFSEAREDAEEKYSQLIKLARIAFRNENGLTSLLPSVLSYSPFDKWLLGAHNLYSSLLANEKALGLLARYQLTQDRIQGMIDGLTDLENIKNQRQVEMGEAQQATKDRNAKMEELRNFCRDLTDVAQIALSDKPQLLEKLGVLVRS